MPQKPSVGTYRQAYTNLYSQQVVPSLKHGNIDIIIINKLKECLELGLPLNEMSCQITSRLSNNLHSYVMPALQKLILIAQ